MSQPTINQKPPKPELEQLLNRGDVWRGHSGRFVRQRVVDSGHDSLNQALLHRGWPLGSLVEVCQPAGCGQGEWLLLAPALLKTTLAGYIVLLNPPALPFAQGLLQAGLDLNRLLVVQAPRKNEFLAGFTELAQSGSCSALLAWSPRQPLTYTELRKCLLASHDGQGLYVVFRPLNARLQSSPASLRLLAQMQPQALGLRIFKQKGLLTRKHSDIQLSLPPLWQGLAPHRWLDHTDTPQNDYQALVSTGRPHVRRGPFTS